MLSNMVHARELKSMIDVSLKDMNKVLDAS